MTAACRKGSGRESHSLEMPGRGLRAVLCSQQHNFSRVSKNQTRNWSVHRALDTVRVRSEGALLVTGEFLGSEGGSVGTGEQHVFARLGHQ